MPVIEKDEIIKMFKEIKLQNQQLTAKVDSLSGELSSFKVDFQKNINELKKQNEELIIENTNLKKRVLACERKTKKYNLIIYNLEGANPLCAVISLFRDKLNISCDEKDLRDVFRLNSGGSINKPKPIIIECLTSRFKWEVLNKAKLLKGSGIFISIDYIAEDYEQRKFLYSCQKAAREEGSTAVIKNNTLIVNGVSYKIDELSQSMFTEESRIRQDSSSSTGSTVSKKRNLENNQDSDIQQKPNNKPNLRSQINK